MAIKGMAMAIPIEGEKKPAKESEESEGSGSGKLAACEDMISAFKRGDAKALMAALDDYDAMKSIPDEEAGEDY